MKYASGYLTAAHGILSCFLCLLAIGETRAAQPTYRELLRRYVVQRNKESARDDPPPGLSVAVERAVGLEYAVMLRKNGVDERVNPESHRFAVGDQIRVRIQPLADLYVYVFFEDESGGRRCLVPSDRNLPRLAKHDQPVELPSDGSVFEFAAASSQETLTIVATPRPDADLSTLCDAVFKKPKDHLSSDELRMLAELKDKNNQSLADLQTRLEQAVSYRGHLSPETMSRVSNDAQRQGAQDVYLERPSGDKQVSALAVVLSRSVEHPKLIVTIPLKSAGGDSAEDRTIAQMRPPGS